MSILDKLFGAKARLSSSEPTSEQALLVKLDAINLPKEIYDAHDLSTLEDQVLNAINGANLGEYDGNEVGEGVATLFLYGSDAERLYLHLEPILRANPLCQGATVVIRQGKPGAPERGFQL